MLRTDFRDAPHPHFGFQRHPRLSAIRGEPAVSQLSPKQLELIYQFARLGEGEIAAHHFTHKFQTEYFARLVEQGVLIRTGRGRYRLYHPLFRQFLQQTE